MENFWAVGKVPYSRQKVQQTKDGFSIDRTDQPGQKKGGEAGERGITSTSRGTAPVTKEGQQKKLRRRKPVARQPDKKKKNLTFLASKKGFGKGNPPRRNAKGNRKLAVNPMSWKTQGLRTIKTITRKINGLRNE